MTIKFVHEFQIDEATTIALNKLLQKSFAYVDYKGRDYFKQLPHYRLLAYKEDKLVGQVGIDYRAMNLNGEAIKIFGIVDLCVDKAYKGEGIGKSLLLEMERIAQQHANKIDYLFLVTEAQEYYKNLGYTATNITTAWLKIDDHKNYGVDKELITDAFFMVKQIGPKEWEDGELDLLGYMY